jgi:hypothetical protein
VLASHNSRELEPLSRRLLQLAGLLSVLLILVVANSLLRDGGNSPFNPNPVAAAAERTEEAPGMRLTLVMHIALNGAPTGTIAGRGLYNSDSHLASVTYDISASDGKRLEADAILGESGWYFRYPQLAGKMPDGKEWIELQGFPGQGEMSQMGESPADALQLLTRVGSVQDLGEARVGNVKTKRYRATLTGEEMVRALRLEGKDELADQFEHITLSKPVVTEAFVDQGGMVRRIHSTVSVFAEGKEVATDTVMDFSDFGIHPDIQVPDGSRVYELPPALVEKFGQFDESS